MYFQEYIDTYKNINKYKIIIFIFPINYLFKLFHLLHMENSIR